jgi:shikimate dehydrogenase
VTPKRFGVLGWPVAHSRSPAMHEAAYAALGLDGWRYQRLPVPPELFAETVRALAAAGFAGANVTIPHKEAALAVASEATARAREIGAANTLTFREDGTIAADNTDAPGLLAALGEWGARPAPGEGAVDASGRTAVVLGAGGSARAVVWALREAGAAVTVVARRQEAARAVAADLGVGHAATPRPADLLVNCTPVGLDDARATPLEDPSAYPTVADMVYREGATELLRRARQAGSRTVDGLEILVRQGALSLEVWTGRPAPLDAMRLGARASG